MTNGIFYVNSLDGIARLTAFNEPMVRDLAQTFPDEVIYFFEGVVL